MGLPAGFKPNHNLAMFLGNLILDLVKLWNYITTWLTPVESYVLRYLSMVGVMGFSF
jgi:hypothetical protein